MARPVRGIVLLAICKRLMTPTAKRCSNRRCRRRNGSRIKTTNRRILKVFWDRGVNTRMNRTLRDRVPSKRRHWMRFWQSAIDDTRCPRTNRWRKNLYCTVSHANRIQLSRKYSNCFSFICFSVKDPTDYQGRSFLHAPHDVGVNLRSSSHPDRCFLPKAHIHTWTGHTKGISAIRLIPKTAHLLLSASMDSRVKVWEVYKERRCIRTYYGHRQAIKDVAWNNNGEQFLSAGYDRYIKLWDTETGDVVHRFTSRKIPFCVKFHPDHNKQHLFVAGTSDKKIICVSIHQSYSTPRSIQ